MTIMIFIITLFWIFAFYATTLPTPWYVARDERTWLIIIATLYVIARVILASPQLARGTLLVFLTHLLSYIRNLNEVLQQ